MNEYFDWKEMDALDLNKIIHLLGNHILTLIKKLINFN